MPRRIACIALPEIRIEIMRERASSKSPLAIIVTRPGGSVNTDRDVLGNTRIDFVSHEARTIGVHAGQTVAAARAKCADLSVRVLPEASVHTALARIAEAALAFGPTTAFDVARDVVWVDVGGCSHLHGGEANLVRALGACVRDLGHAWRIAVADGPRIAEAIARFSNRPATIVPEGKGDIAVRSLPIAALALDENASEWLFDLGLRTCGDLQKLPRRALGVRIGERVHDVMSFLDGRDPSPLRAWRPPEVPEERAELDWGAQSIEALAFVLKTLCDRLAARLHGRALAAARLEVVFALDRALLADDPGTSHHRPVLSISLPSPIARASDLLAVVRAKLERYSLAAPVLAVTLRATELAAAPGRPIDLLAPEPKAERALPRLVAELGAEYGEGVVGTLALVDTWLPSERTVLRPFEGLSSEPASTAAAGFAWAAAWPGDVPPSFSGRALVTSAPEPSRLVQASPIPRAALAGARHLARIEEVEWWRRPAHSSGGGRDLFAAWVGDALAWLELRHDRTSGVPVTEDPLLRGWMD